MTNPNRNLAHPSDGKTIRLLHDGPQGAAGAVITVSPYFADQLIAANKAELVEE
jgi:hypothetical protein